MGTTYDERTGGALAATAGTLPASAAHAVAAGAALVAVAADLAWMLLIGEAIPPLVGFAVITSGVVLGLRSRPRARTGALVGLAVVMLAMGGRFVVAEAGHPEDFGGFAWAVLSGGGRVVTLVAGVAALRGAAVLGRRIGASAAAVAGALLAVSAVATLSVGDDELQAGDVVVPANASTFPERIEVASGGAVLVRNEDPFRHTFTVRAGGAATDVDVDLPPGVDRRIPIELAPGTYDVHCTVHGHEAMTATLLVR